ncbi:MAG: class I SAM-dependent methyltransferase [Lachnospiraceae bacterium]|nr:class I SAM-dependent methyltransferase [Lachnospiraceae bacterium]
MPLEHNRNLTDAGNPAKPAGKAGEDMLLYMNKEHKDLTLWALDIFERGAGDRILDIGCGGGETIRVLSERIPTGHFTGIDHSEVSVKLSGETNASSIREGRTEILSGSVSELPFEDGSFDRIITVESFYFWPDPPESLKEVYRVLTKGGRFFLVSEIYERPDLTGRSRSNIEKYKMNVPGIGEFKELFREAGFSDTEIHLKDGEYWIVVEGIK